MKASSPSPRDAPSHTMSADTSIRGIVVDDDDKGINDDRDDRDDDDRDHASSVFMVGRLKDLYRDRVADAEKRYHLHYNFRLPTDGEIKDSEFDTAPMVLLIGQYSTGKVRGFYLACCACQSFSCQSDIIIKTLSSLYLSFPFALFSPTRSTDPFAVYIFRIPFRPRF
jgi:hypothetical protein